jgi:hypothetical protein
VGSSCACLSFEGQLEREARHWIVLRRAGTIAITCTGKVTRSPVASARATASVTARPSLLRNSTSPSASLWNSQRRLLKIGTTLR